jgi:PAS domain S-box-containing protein
MTREVIVLIGGTDAAVSQRLAAMLQAQGYQVRATPGDMRELAQVYSDPPALILLPPRIGEFSGLKLCRMLKNHKRTQHIPVLVVTGDLDEQDEALRSGACDVIPTPLRQEQVLARVHAYFELATLRSARREESHNSHGWSADLADLGKEDGWVRLALQAGRMFAFDWDILTDTMLRSRDSAVILGIDAGACSDTGSHAFRQADPEDWQRLQNILAILSPAYDMYDTKLRVARCDGKAVTLRVTGRGLFDARCRLTRVIGVAADITDQVAARTELEQSRTDLLQLIQNLPISAALVNNQDRIEYVNDRFTRTFGYDLQDLTVPDQNGHRSRSNADCRQEVIEAWDGFSNGLSRHDHVPPREHHITGKDGVRHSVMVFSGMAAKRKLILFDDVTEHKRAEASLRESEERFRVMADTAPVMLWVSGTDRLCTFFNKSWLTFTGRTMEQEVGNGWAEGVHPDDLERCLAVYNAGFDSRESFQMEYRLRRADGEYRWILDTGTPRFAAEGTFAGYIGSGVEITDLKRRQEEMLAAQRLESLGVLAGGVAHDFNNLLGCILANADVTMSELDADSPARGGLEQIEAVAVRASQIVRQIMTYIGEEQEDLEPVNLSSLVREMAQLLRVCIPKRAILNIDVPPSLVIPRANAAQLRQVVMNLIINAGEAIGDQGGVITVAGTNGGRSPGQRDRGRQSLAKVAGSGSGFVCLEIADTGAGMTPEVQQRMFDPFYSTKLPGRGFGLAAVQAIVQAHGGVIEVTSAPGQGATFHVLFPSDANPPVHVPGKKPAIHERLSRRGTVLIVEDEETLRVSVAKMLRRKGFSVVEAGDSELAMQLIHDPGQHIALVLLDLTLPGKMSHQVFDELRRARPGLKVIFTSATGLESVADPMLALDRETFIRKPYHLNDLVSVVRQALPLETADMAEGALAN